MISAVGCHKSCDNNNDGELYFNSSFIFFNSKIASFTLKHHQNWYAIVILYT